MFLLTRRVLSLDHLAALQYFAMTYSAAPALLQPCEDLHLHGLDAAFREDWKPGEPFLDVGLRVVGLEISLVGEYLIEDEMTRLLSIFLKEIDDVLGVSPNERDQRQ